MTINRFIRSTLRHSKLIILLTLALTVFLGIQAGKIGIDTDVNTLMTQRNSRILRIREQIGVETETRYYLFVSIRGRDLYNLNILGTFEDTIDAILDIPEITAALTPFNFVFFESQGRRIIPATISPTGRAPKTAEDLALFEKRVKENALSENFVVADGGRILTAVFTNEPADDHERFMNAFREAVAPLEEVTTVYFTGEVPFQERISQLLSKDFSVLLILAGIAMLTIFWLSFRSLRAVILPIMVVMIGAVWCLGVMAMLGFPITVVTVIIPSMILTIGSSYTIHVLNEYFRSARISGTEKNQWLADSVEHVIRTVILAALTTMISFLSLLFTTLRPLQEFGLSIGLGILFCGVLALFFLPAVFSLIGPPRDQHRERVTHGILTRSAAIMGQWAARRRLLTAGIFLLLFAGFLVCYPLIRHQSDYFAYFPSNDRIIKDARFINKNSGGSQTFNITLSAPGGQKNHFLNPEVLETVDRFETVLGAHPSVTNTLSFNGILKTMNRTLTNSPGLPESRGLILLLGRYFRMIPNERISLGQEASIINDEASSITIYLKVAEAETYSIMGENDMRRFLDFIDAETELAFGESLDVYLWGNSMLLLDSSRTIKRDQLRSTIISITLGMVISWIFFRSAVFGVMVLIPLLSGIFFYFIILFISGIPLDMTTILVTNVTVGVGLDDAVHFILQYCKQRMLQPCRLALSSSLRITGRPIVLTTLSLVAGLLMLCFAGFKPVVFFGFLIAGTLFSTMVGTIIFIPAAIIFHETFRETLRRRGRLM